MVIISVSKYLDIDGNKTEKQKKKIFNFFLSLNEAYHVRDVFSSENYILSTIDSRFLHYVRPR